MMIIADGVDLGSLLIRWQLLSLMASHLLTFDSVMRLRYLPLEALSYGMKVPMTVSSA